MSALRYLAAFLRVAAWGWAILVIAGICGLSIWLNGFSEGMSKASLMIFSPAALYIFLPSVVLGLLGDLVRKNLETG
ncbi:MAG TPA: hypothetical protein VGM16_03815 [Gammaproteobacteria bacterium]